MQLKTIFNRVTEYKPFVVEHVELIEYKSQSTIEISMRARENGLPTCSGCGERCSGYDTQPKARRFDFVPLWIIPVVLVYTMRRVNCPSCGVKVERVPWSEGKSPLTTEQMVLGWLVSSDELEGSGGVLSGELGSRLQLRKTCGCLGVIASQPR